jgi:CDGSH-type Zn-finger protein
MTDPIVAQKGPYRVKAEAGRIYFWCACGRSRTQPFCDGSHKGTGLAPVKWSCTDAGEVWFCGCKQTSGRPFCDGTHSTL